MNAIVGPPTESARIVDDIRSFIAASSELPTPRGAALQLIRLTRDPDVSTQHVVRVVKSDPALTSFVLRAANASVFAGLGRAIEVPQAVTRLGFVALRAYALTVSMMQHHCTGKCAAFDYPGFWARSLMTAIAFSNVARRGRYLHGEEAFALGLLAQVGRLAFSTAAAEDYGRIIRASAGDEDRLRALEREHFGFDHCELTSVLLVEWGFPTRLGDAVFWQHDPEAGGFGGDSFEYRLASEIRFAVMLADLCFAGAERVRERVPVLLLRAEIAGLGADSVPELSDRMVGEWTGWAPTIGAMVPSPHPLLLD